MPTFNVSRSQRSVSGHVGNLTVQFVPRLVSMKAAFYPDKVW